MSIDLPKVSAQESPIAVGPVLAELRRQCATIEQFATSQFDDFERLRNALVHREETLDAWSRELDRREAALTAQSGEAAAEDAKLREEWAESLARSQRKIEELQAELEQQRNQTTAAEDALREIEPVVDQRDQLQEQLESANAIIVQLEGRLDEVTQSRAHLETQLDMALAAAARNLNAEQSTAANGVPDARSAGGPSTKKNHGKAGTGDSPQPVDPVVGSLMHDFAALRGS